jgi:hypothetical protein
MSLEIQIGPERGPIYQHIRSCSQEGRKAHEQCQVEFAVECTPRALAHLLRQDYDHDRRCSAVLSHPLVNNDVFERSLRYVVDIRVIPPILDAFIRPERLNDRHLLGFAQRYDVEHFIILRYP